MDRETVSAQLALAEDLAAELMRFAVEYGFQILGALIFLFIGLKLAGWAGRRVTALAEARGIDITLARFLGTVLKAVAVVILAIITLGNFGIQITPLIALAGATAFGGTLALQGPISNYGAGLAIILSRPFTVGDTVTVQGRSGVVEDVKLAATLLRGEDGEAITVPNKQVVGQVIVNSEARRVVQTRIAVAAGGDWRKALDVLRGMAAQHPALAESAPQIGVHDFTYGGVVLGLRYWVPSKRYFETRYAVNEAALSALEEAGVPLLAAAGALPLGSLSADDDEQAHRFGGTGEAED